METNKNLLSGQDLNLQGIRSRLIPYDKRRTRLPISPPDSVVSL
jgi:hypothetical protein